MNRVIKREPRNSFSGRRERVGYMKDTLMILFIGIWMMFGLYGFLVAIDLDGSRARLKEYDRRHTNPFGQRIDCKKELDDCRTRLKQYDERHAEDLLGGS